MRSDADEFDLLRDRYEAVCIQRGEFDANRLANPFGRNFLKALKFKALPSPGNCISIFCGEIRRLANDLDSASGSGPLLGLANCLYFADGRYLSNAVISARSARLSLDPLFPKR